jgi:hypothetical protein
MMPDLRRFASIALFAFFTFAVYEQATYPLDRKIKKLEEKKEHLQEEIVVKQLEQDSLKLQIASWSDPGWLELVLMKNLGVVPEGYTKIYFEDKK